MEGPREGGLGLNTPGVRSRGRGEPGTGLEGQHARWVFKGGGHWTRLDFSRPWGHKQRNS